MELHKTTNRQAPATRQSVPAQFEFDPCAVTPRAVSGPPEPYNPRTLFKREDRDEQVFDIDGTLWDVKEARATKYGFDLLFGIPANSRLGRFIGPKRIIATPALVAFWETHRTDEGYIYDLPAGRTTLKRVRNRLRLNFIHDRRQLWKKRQADLQTLPTVEFAERYNVSKELANSWRLLLLGRTARPLNWWHHPAALAVLRKRGIKLREIGKALDVGTSHAHRLRLRALKMAISVPEKAAAGPIPKARFERKPTLPKLGSPFRESPKQGQMFVGSPYWSKKSPARLAKEAAARRTKPKGSRASSQHSHSQETAKRVGQMLLPFKPARGPEAKPVLFQVQDFQGTFYDVYEARSTEHGFDLLFGFRARAHRRLYTDKGKPGLIATPELVSYWQAGGNLNLPAGLTTLIRLRARFGLGRGRSRKPQQPNQGKA